MKFVYYNPAWRSKIKIFYFIWVATLDITAHKTCSLYLMLSSSRVLFLWF